VRLERKSSLLHIVTLLIWGACSCLMTPLLFGNVYSGSAASRVTVAAILLLLHIFWLYGAYFSTLTLFSFWRRRPRIGTGGATTDFPPIAILYTTCNDFQAAAVQSALEQDYPHFQLFVLDDSSDPVQRDKVDAFVSEHPGRVTLIRRADRVHAKAGNLNHALNNEARSFPFFAIMDADSRLPKDFLRSLIPSFGESPDIGFVQAAHRPLAEQPTRFAGDLSLLITALWQVCYASRNAFGFVSFLGHGGIVRYDVWKEVGGFPNVVSEDLAFSTRAAQFGYRGLYVPDVYCEEEFPSSYAGLRRRHYKYTQGALEFLHKEFPSFAGSGRTRWNEKLDVLLGAGSHLLPGLFAGFLWVFCVAFQLINGSFGERRFHLGPMSDFDTPAWVLPSYYYEGFYGWEMLIVTAVCVAAPAWGIVTLVGRFGFRAIRTLLLATLPYGSLPVMGALAIAKYVAGGRAQFLVTADDQSGRHDRLGPAGDVTRCAELCVGTVLTTMTLICLNVVLFPTALAVLLSPLLHNACWSKRWMRPILYAPLPLVACGFLAWVAELFYFTPWHPSWTSTAIHGFLSPRWESLTALLACLCCGAGIWAGLSRRLLSIRVLGVVMFAAAATWLLEAAVAKGNMPNLFVTLFSASAGTAGAMALGCRRISRVTEPATSTPGWSTWPRVLTFALTLGIFVSWLGNPSFRTDELIGFPVPEESWWRWPNTAEYLKWEGFVVPALLGILSFNAATLMLRPGHPWYQLCLLAFTLSGLRWFMQLDYVSTWPARHGDLLALVALMECGVLLLIRGLGFRLTLRDDSGRSSPLNGLQFSLTGLMSVMAYIAVILAMTRYLDGRSIVLMFAAIIPLIVGAAWAVSGTLAIAESIARKMFRTFIHGADDEASSISAVGNPADGAARS
jgi:cellulose synthase/poly-beta-1,6-N-acetylglucosamine synthase-like glycosyltransferase